MIEIRKKHGIPEHWQIVQSFPTEWNATPKQQAALAKFGDADDLAMFDAIITKGMVMLDAMHESCGTNGVRQRCRMMASRYFAAAQTFSTMQHETREWESYFPWIVFNNRYYGRRVEWIEWAVKKFGRDYATCDTESILRAYKERDE